MQDYEKLGLFYLGKSEAQTAEQSDELLLYDSRELTTHAVILGMTGSGKTGLAAALIEEAAIDGIPAILIDPKGDLGNLMLQFPNLAGADFLPWVDHGEAQRRAQTPEQFADATANKWREGLAARSGKFSCAIPDRSRMRVEAGATLRLNGSAEMVGPLSGEGTVVLDGGTTLGINAFEDATFAGTINAAGGTLQLAGDHTQSFTGAAVSPGAFTVDFRGGRFGGLLHVGGALTITGAVAYVQPDSYPASVPLFTFGSIDATSRAALEAGAASMAVPLGLKARVVFTPTSATLVISAPGTILLLR